MDGYGIALAIGALKAIAFVCDILTFPVYVLLQRPWKVRALSRRVKVRKQTTDHHIQSASCCAPFAYYLYGIGHMGLSGIFTLDCSTVRRTARTLPVLTPRTVL